MLFTYDPFTALGCQKRACRTQAPASKFPASLFQAKSTYRGDILAAMHTEQILTSPRGAVLKGELVHTGIQVPNKRNAIRTYVEILDVGNDRVIAL